MHGPLQPTGLLGDPERYGMKGDDRELEGAGA